jgi:sporulation protein YqfC
MREWNKKIRRLAAAALDLPEYAVLRVPRLVLTGDRRLTVENHRGVDLFADGLLRLKLEDGGLEIAGDGLCIRHIGRDEVQIEGRIREIRFVGRPLA